MADQGGCSANEATSFASVSVAKRLCRIVRVVGYEIAVFITILKVTPLRRLHLIRAAKAAHLLLKEKPFGGCSCQLAPIIALGFRTQLSPAPQMARATPSLTQAAFTSYTGSLLLSLYAPRYCLTASAGFGRQFTKLRALSRLRRRYDSRKKRIPSYLSHPSFPLPHFLVNIRWRILTTRTISGMLYMLQKC